MAHPVDPQLVHGLPDVFGGGVLSRVGGRAQAAEARTSASTSLASGKVDRSKFTEHLNTYFDATVVGDYHSSLARLGTPTSFEVLCGPRLRGGFVNRNFTIHYAGKPNLKLVTYAEPGATGRFEQYMIMPE